MAHVGRDPGEIPTQDLYTGALFLTIRNGNSPDVYQWGLGIQVVVYSFQGIVLPGN